MGNVGIIGLGHYLPKRRLTNRDLEKLVDTTDEWIFSRTGIKERRLAKRGETNSVLAIQAAKEALKNAKLSPAKVDLIIVATISPDSSFPSVACLVQKAIGAKNAAAFDIGAACSGFLYGVTTAKQYLASGLYKNALVIAMTNRAELLRSAAEFAASEHDVEAVKLDLRPVVTIYSGYGFMNDQFNEDDDLHGWTAGVRPRTRW